MRASGSQISESIEEKRKKDRSEASLTWGPDGVELPTILGQKKQMKAFKGVPHGNLSHKRLWRSFDLCQDPASLSSEESFLVEGGCVCEGWEDVRCE